jgi:glycerol kinase
VRVLVAVDAGTTGVRALAVDVHGRVLAIAYRTLAQSYPAPGRVEHDAAEILAHVDDALLELGRTLHAEGHRIEAIGITNQRETTVALDRDDGRILAPAIVWQDRRTAPQCAALAASGAAATIRARTGLPCDPYFSATKMRWLLDHAPLDGAARLGLCTIDTLVCWHLTGGALSGAYVTDASNASRTMLYDLDAGDFTDELCELLGVPRTSLATLTASSAVAGAVAAPTLPALRGIPVAGILGDQQAALFGQRCLADGMVKATFGTGAFLLANAGTTRPADVDGLVTTVAWDLGGHGPRAFALEGSAFVAGAAIQWLRDDLGLVHDSAEVGPLAGSVDDANGALFVPAFTGLGSPWWDPAARGSLVGLSRGVTRAHVARAVVESLAHQGRAILEAMREGGVGLAELRVDGGASAMDLLCQLLADGTRCTVRRPRSIESTAIGAALAAGLATDCVTLEELADSWEADATFEPGDAPFADTRYEGWLDAVRRVRDLGSAAPRGERSTQ